MKIKLFTASIFIIIIFTFGYWFKCHEGIDLMKSFHLGNYLPMKFLQGNFDTVAFANETKDLLNDSFESQKSTGNWSELWMREKGKVKQSYDVRSINGSRCLLIESKSEKDWSYGHSKLIQAKEGDVFGFRGVIKIQSEEINAALSIILYDRDKMVIKWHYAKENVKKTDNWTKVEQRFMVPKGVEYIRFRLTGYGKGKSWFDDIKFQREEKSIIVDKNLKQYYSLENALLLYKFDVQKGIISVLDKRAGKEWIASTALDNFYILEVKEINDFRLDLKIIETESMQQYKIAITLGKDLAEVAYEIEQIGDEEFDKLEFPPIFAFKDGMQIVVPLQEGILIPRYFASDDFPWRLRYYGGRLSMAFIGVVDGERGWMEIIETPSDFEIKKYKDKDTKLLLKNRWISEEGKFGYKRKIKYCFFDKGGYVAMAKRYRRYIKDNKRLFKTLKEKNAKRRGNIFKLVGAVNVWYWDVNRREFARDMVKAGIKKVLFSNVKDRGDIQSINDLGFLTSRYDIYQDVWPLIYHNVTSRHDGWPEDLVLDENGEWIEGWTIKKGLKEYPGGVICSIKGLERAKREIPKDLKDKPYSARFIDTTTASPWREDYNPKHPTTRSEDIKYKMELLRFCSEDMRLVTGSENGVDSAIPYCDYFEGMMSIGIGRLPGIGRNVASVKYEKPTEKFLKYQVGEKYRIPLWELVFGDCVVSTWYWGDSSNRIPEYWWKKDLFNILYGNMPLWAIRDWKHWKQYRDRFIESYKNVNSVFEKVGFEEMINHRFVSEDRSIQETTFSNGIRVVVNFGKEKYILEDSKYNLPAKGFVVFDKGEVWKEGVCD